MRWLLSIGLLVVLGAGCTSMIDFDQSSDDEATLSNDTIQVPIEGYNERRTLKIFGEYISDRFIGYHVGDDVEFTDVSEEVSVVAISDGTVEQVKFVAGYGGFVLIKHSDVRAIYGHLDLESIELKSGDTVAKGQLIGNLGDDRTQETDGERKHLHFGLYDLDQPVKINGYEQSTAAIENWINPTNYFAERGLDMLTPSRRYAAPDIGSNIFALEFEVPEGMEVEYVPSIKALNIFTLAGDGTARARSQIFIRYFDADEFQTLTTVDVLTTEDLVIGDDYEARRYTIEKKAKVADFADQPAWRNAEHVVTDVRAETGLTRYYVIAANPELDVKIYEDVLKSLVILTE